MINYVVGFLYSEDWNNVLLIKKNRPKWQEGWWNGPGGHIEEKDDTIYDAITREFKEETGIRIKQSWWNLGPIVECPSCRIYYFYYNSDEIKYYSSNTDEQVMIWIMDDLPRNFISPSSWICRMLTDPYLKKYQKELYLYYSVDESR